MLAGSTSAQVAKIRPMAVTPIHSSDKSPAERLNRMEAAIYALKAQVADDQVKLKAANDAANQAKALASFINVGLSGQIKGIKSDVGEINANLGQTNANLSLLSAKFANHTHKFNTFTVQTHADGSITDLHYTVANTMPPSN